MDNLTHTLAGAALGEAGLKRMSRYSMAALMIGANIPDVDAVAMLYGNDLTFRRGWTHGPVGLLVLPVLLTAALVLWGRWRERRADVVSDDVDPGDQAGDSVPPIRPRELYFLALIGALSHPFLDWLNTYGIRLLMPFSERWYYGDTLFIIDPWVWAALGIGVGVSRRLRHTRASQVALAAVVIYIFLMKSGSSIARERGFEASREIRAEAHSVLASPVPLDPFVRRLVLDLGDAYRFGKVRFGLNGVTTELEGGSLPKLTRDPRVVVAIETDEISDFLYWSRYPFFTVADEPGGYTVRVGDARYADTTGGGWASAEVFIAEDVSD